MEESVIYQIAQQSHTQMMSYLIVSRNGSLIVIDGGTASDARYLIHLMKTVSCSSVPHISAWLLTHAHSDHLDALLELFQNYAGAFTLDKIYHHFPDPEFIRINEPSSYHTIEEYVRLSSRFWGREVVVNIGDLIIIDNVCFEVLYTTDSSLTHNALNNSSTVFKMSAEGVSLLFLGDLGVEGGEKLLHTNHPDKLKSDIVELSHHGQSGVDFPVYKVIAPRLAMWCTPLWLWENNQGSRGPGSGPWKIEETRGWMDQLGVMEHIVAKDGTYKVTLRGGKYETELYS